MENLPSFQDLSTSTRTVMAYSNLDMDLEKIFTEVEITNIDIPLTKKKKNVDKKKLKAEKGSIISAQHTNRHRGVNTKKTRKHWCSVNCRLTKVDPEDETETRVLSVVERFVFVEGSKDIYETQYYCNNCQQTFKLKELKKIVNFLNQVTIVMSMGDIILNIMIFKDNFKIAGCKTDEDAIEAMRVLWSRNIRMVEGGYTIKKNHLGNFHPSFLFRLVMKNVDFKLGFFIDREELNRLMNDKKYNEIVFMSQCETTGHTNVNIKLYCNRPADYRYRCMILENAEDPLFLDIPENPYKVEKKKKDKITFIVFSSSEIILSGRYDSEMEKAYNFFIKTIFENKNRVEEKIKKPNIQLSELLK